MRIGNCLLKMSAVLAVGLVQAGVEILPAQAQTAATLTGPLQVDLGDTSEDPVIVP